MVKINGYDYQLSNRKYKKLKVFVNGKWVHFGDNRYDHYYDKTGLLPKSMNHKDEKRRLNYLKRAMGQANADDPNSASWHAVRLLWNGK
jgi:hypothetical protein